MSYLWPKVSTQKITGEKTSAPVCLCEPDWAAKALTDTDNRGRMARGGDEKQNWRAWLQGSRLCCVSHCGNLSLCIRFFFFFMCAGTFDQLAHGWLSAGFRTSESSVTHSHTLSKRPYYTTRVFSAGIMPYCLFSLSINNNSWANNESICAQSGQGVSVFGRDKKFGFHSHQKRPETNWSTHLLGQLFVSENNCLVLTVKCLKIYLLISIHCYYG